MDRRRNGDRLSAALPVIAVLKLAAVIEGIVGAV
jgi:hypothetical protein